MGHLNVKAYETKTIGKEIFFLGLNFKYLGTKSSILISASDHLVKNFLGNLNVKAYKTKKFQNFINWEGIFFPRA